VAANRVVLGQADPETPAELNDHAADAWAPLFAIADAAGGEWPARARKAAIELSGGDSAQALREMLLSDIRGAFAARKTGRRTSDGLIACLNVTR
jgi:putative DNA primase/helicase